MPAALDMIDWSGIQAASVVIGVREAARRAASDLPPDEQNRFVERVMKRSSREGWLKQIADLREQEPVMQQAKPLSAPVRNGADSICEALKDHERETTLSLARTARKNAAEAEEAGLDAADKALATGKLLALVHRWDKGSAGNTTVNALVLVNAESQ